MTPTEWKALAMKATKGTTWGAKGWQADHSEDGPGATPRYCVGANGIGHFPVAWVYEEHDAAFIAASSPERVIELLDENERLKGLIALCEGGNSSARDLAPTITDARVSCEARHADTLFAIRNQLEAAKSSLMFNNRWTNEAGYITDAALWIQRSILTAHDALSSEALPVSPSEASAGSLPPDESNPPQNRSNPQERASDGRKTEVAERSEGHRDRPNVTDPGMPSRSILK